MEQADANHIPTAQDVAQVQAMTDALRARNQALETFIQRSTENPNYSEDERALMADATAWAVHYSNVRLGIMAIAIPITLGLVAINVNSLQWASWISIWVLWLAAAATFGFLTASQADRLNKRFANLNNILVSRGQAAKPNASRPRRFFTDKHLYTVLCLTIVLGGVSYFRISNSLSDMKWPENNPSQTTHEIEGQINGQVGGKFDATFKSK